MEHSVCRQGADSEQTVCRQGADRNIFTPGPCVEHFGEAMADPPQDVFLVACGRAPVTDRGIASSEHIPRSFSLRGVSFCAHRHRPRGGVSPCDFPVGFLRAPRRVAPHTSFARRGKGLERQRSLGHGPAVDIRGGHGVVCRHVLVRRPARRTLPLGYPALLLRATPRGVRRVRRQVGWCNSYRCL